MKNEIRHLIKVGCAIFIGLSLSQNQPAFAGWTGLINGVGTGWASVNVRSSKLTTNRVTTLNNTASPSAAMSPTTGYKTNAPLPIGAATNTFSRIKGLPGGVWQASANAAVGDGTDNAELQNRIAITPADCASLTFDSMINQTQAEFSTNGNLGTITVNAKATGGTALWLRGFEYTGLMENLPSDNPDTVENETIEYLKVNGVVKFETLVLGPFEFGGVNCPLIVPFTLNSGNLENFIFAADGVALSLPLIIICPPGIETKCDQPFSYPPVQYAGCGDIAISYNPPAPIGGTFPAGSFPVGVTPVTVTATDSAGNSTNCTFTVTVTDTTSPIVPALPTLTGEASVTVPQPPPVTDNCGGVVTATTSDPLIYTSQGAFIVRWTYDDGHGNSTTANQTVIVDDVTPPVAPALATVTGQCSATVTTPVALDAVVGNVSGTTSSPLTYSSQGTYTIVWSFDDGNGNTSTANQTVIVKDTIPPVKPTLANVTGSCGASVTLPAPTTTDSCAGTVTGTTTTVFPITAAGTNVVTWTFNDGNGNSTTATQTVVVAGLTFNGFYSPIGGTGGTCGSPLRTVNLGNNLPVKFDERCSGSPFLIGRPKMSIEKSSANCNSLTPILAGEFTLVGNEWHFNWNTGSGGVTAGAYKLTVTLQDGTSRFVWIRLR